MAKLKNQENDYKEIVDINSIEYLEEKKIALYKVMVLSGGIDVLMTIPETVTMFQTLGGSIIIEEIIEYFISNTIAKYGIDTDVKMTDRVVGFIPFPGVTGLNIRCFKELRKINKQIKKLEKAQRR